MSASAPNRQAGVAAIELAAVLGFCVALLIGVIELSRGVQQFATLAASARAAARLVAVRPDLGGIAQARCLAVYGRTDSGCESAGSPLVAGLSTAQVLISLPVDLHDGSGLLVLSGTPALSSIQAQSADGTSAGTLDLVTVTLGSKGSPVRFTPLLPGLIPAFDFAPVSVSMALSVN